MKKTNWFTVTSVSGILKRIKRAKLIVCHTTEISPMYWVLAITSKRGKTVVTVIDANTLTIAKTQVTTAKWEYITVLE